MQEQLVVPELKQRQQMAEAALGYIIGGWIAECVAKELADAPIEVRRAIASDLQALSETDLEPGEQNRAQWTARLLCREELTQGAKTIFIETASLPKVTGRKGGLGERAFTSGRHSSGDTSGW